MIRDQKRKSDTSHGVKLMENQLTPNTDMSSPVLLVSVNKDLPALDI